MAKNPNINKYNKGLISVRSLKPSDEVICLPNAKYDNQHLKKRTAAQIERQRLKYGFDSGETIALDYTASVWVYSHLKMLLDIGGKYIDYEWEDAPFDREALEKIGVDTKKYHNEKLIIEYICELLETADKFEHTQPAHKPFKNDNDWYAAWNKQEEDAIEIRKKAFMIFAIMLHRLGR